MWPVWLSVAGWNLVIFFAALVVMQRDSVRAECVRKAQGAPCLRRGSSARESENLPLRLIFRPGARQNCRSGVGCGLAQERFDFCIGHRFGKVIPLKNIAATALDRKSTRLNSSH